MTLGFPWEIVGALEGSIPFGNGDNALATPLTETESTLVLDAHPEKLRVIPLGGLEEFGLNIMCYEIGGERILVDCGAMFPDADMPGVDLVIPDVTWLLPEIDKLKAIVLTHGHDDHIGALPYILPSLNVPVYGTRLTLAYLENKLEEHNLLEQTELVEMEYRKPVSISEHFTIEAVHVTHSIPNAALIAVRTAAGTVLHTGDYKIDHSPVTGDFFDFGRLAALGEEGVLALVGDSTNSDVPGSTHTERWVRRHLEPIFAASEKSIFCSTFSTSIHRIQLLMDLAVEFDRRIFIVGRSLERTLRLGTDHGFLHPPSSYIRPLREMQHVKPRKRLILATGSQAEPMSAMSRIAVGEHRQVKMEQGDTVILSARVIPGHLRPINRMINHFYKQGARVYDSQSFKVHASGHAYREEMKTMIGLTRPDCIIPVHGELRQRVNHRNLAIAMGYEPEDVFLLENGDILEFGPKEPKIVGKRDTGHVLVDGKTVGETGEVVLRDRQHLSEDGMVIAIMNVDLKTRELLNEPEIVTRGFVYVDESETMINELRHLARAAFEAAAPESREDIDILQTEIRRAIRKHLRKNLNRFPVILPVVQML